MECTFSPALVSNLPAPAPSSDGDKDGGKPSADTDAAAAGGPGAGAERTESIHERLYKLRVRAQVRGRPVLLRLVARC